MAVDNDGGTDTNSRIDRTLDAGTYTIEATTYLGEVTGPFTLTLRDRTPGFSTEPVEPGWNISAWHVNELRRAVAALR